MHTRGCEEGRLGLGLISVRTIRLGRHGQESRSQGSECRPMRERIPRPHLALLSGRQLGTRSGTVPGSTTPLQKWAATLPSPVGTADSRPYHPWILSGRLLEGKAGVSSVPVSEFLFIKMRKIRTMH